MEISKVSATLENGRIFSKGILVLLYIGGVSSFLVFLIGMLMAVTNFLENGIAQGVLFLSCVLLVCGVFIGGFTFLIIRDKKLKKEIKIYLQDAVLLEAQTEDRTVEDVQYKSKGAEVNGKKENAACEGNS